MPGAAMFSNFPMGSYRSRKAAMASAARSAEKPQKPAKESCRGGPMNLMRVLSGGTGSPSLSKAYRRLLRMPSLESVSVPSRSKKI